MISLWIWDGKVDNIPPIGTQLEITQYLKFKVEGYGESTEIPDPFGERGTVQQLELIGCLVIPAGSPMYLLESLLAGMGSRWPDELDTDPKETN